MSDAKKQGKEGERKGKSFEKANGKGVRQVAPVSFAFLFLTLQETFQFSTDSSLVTSLHCRFTKSSTKGTGHKVSK